MEISGVISVRGASLDYERRIRAIFRRYPAWLMRAARLSGVEVSASVDLRDMVASFDHATRSLRVYTNMPEMLLVRAIGHELWHAADDNFEHPHYFSSMEGWLQAHRDQTYFELPKYRDEPLEYFADVATKYFLFGRERLRITHPRETQFLEEQVIPVLQDAFGG